MLDGLTPEQKEEAKKLYMMSLRAAWFSCWTQVNWNRDYWR